MHNIARKRIVAVTVLALVGTLGLWWNWHMIHTEGSYYPKLAGVSPIFIVFAVYFAIVNEDPTHRPTLSVRYVLTMVLAIALGIVNWYAISHALY